MSEVKATETRTDTELMLAGLRHTLRMLHWQTLGSNADGTLKGMPVCGCCAWLDGIRKPWPCDTLKAVGVSS